MPMLPPPDGQYVHTRPKKLNLELLAASSGWESSKAKLAKVEKERDELRQQVRRNTGTTQLLLHF